MANETAVTVNGIELSAETIQVLEQTYRTRLLRGSFWYDAVSGLWGVWGGPAFGVIQPGLQLGGPLPFEASGGQTNVVINGRAIHPLEYAATIAMFGYVIPGRWRLDHQGNIGPEGGPALFNLHAARLAQGGRGWYRAGSAGWMSSDGDSLFFTGGDGETWSASAY
jgi:hypothetical protein